MKFDPNRSQDVFPQTEDGGFLWSQGQRLAYEELIDLAQIFFALDWPRLPLRARLNPLVVSPSGAGKSFLIHRVCQKLGLPCLRLTFGEWIVMGAREVPHTVHRIHSFVDENPRGVIHIDELDKFRATHTSDWSTSVIIEMFLLLDRSLQQPGRDFQWTPVLKEKLSTSFFIVGSGTWQSIWDQSPKHSIGFRTGFKGDPVPIQEEIERSGIIAPELLRRFNSDLIILPQAEEADYRNAAKMFGLDSMAQDLEVELNYAEAVRRRIGARWLEETFCRLLRKAQSMGKPMYQAKASIVPEKPDWDPDDEDPPDTALF